MERAQNHFEDTELVILLTTIVIHVETGIGENNKLQARNVLGLLVSPLWRPSMQNNIMQDML